MSRKYLAGMISLLLVFFATRLIAIDQFPMFTDEAFHIRFARNVVDKGVLSNAEEGRQLTIWLYTLVQADQNAAIFVARAATLLTLLPGLAALIASGWRLAGLWGALFTGLLLQFSVYHMFFERMALADPVSASALSVALYLTIRRGGLRGALLTAMMLFIAFAAKVSALPFVALPLAGAVFRRPAGQSWRQSLGWAGLAMGTGGLLIAGFSAVLIWQQHDPFFYLLRGTGESSDGLMALLLTRIPSNIQSTLVNLSGFLGVHGLLLLGVALLVLVLRRRWFLPVLVAGSMAIFWLNNRPDTRHLIIPVNIALLAGGVVLADLARGRSRLWQRGLVVLVIVMGLLTWLPFSLTLNSDPAALSFIGWNDYHQYIASEGSGSGLAEVADVLAGYQPQQVLGLFANCWALEYMAADQLPITCPRVNPNGSDVPALTQLLHDSRAEGVYAVLETIAYVPAESPGRLVATIERPANGPQLRIYDLSPDTG